MKVIDGSQGEGGGQVLRSALALSLVTGTPFRIERIRAGRERPGLLRQHLACVRAATEIGGGECEGAELGSSSLAFRPGRLRPGSHRFAVGTAGSAALVLQSVLPALLPAEGEFELVIEGGTHAEAAPPFEFLERVYAPAIARMGGRFEVALERHGFFPAGGGRIRARVTGATLHPVELLERGERRSCTARAMVANIPFGIAERELAVLRQRLSLAEADARGESVADSAGPGNAVIVEIECEHATEVVSSFGSLRRSAESVAMHAADQAIRFIAAQVPVGRHLADQILLPLALAGGGSFRTMRPTAHARTNADVIREFLGTRISFREEARDAWRCDVEAP